MPYCKHCKVWVRDDTGRCPLCGNPLTQKDEESAVKSVFPRIPLDRENHMAIRIMVFISFAGIVGSFAIRLMYPTQVNWPVFVVFGLMSMWISLIIILKKRHNIHKTIIWQVTIVSLLSIFWDWQTGWRGWSLDYFLPIIYMAAILVMYVTAKILKLRVRDYLMYVLIDGFLGIIPIMFLVFGWVNVIYPSVICAVVSVIFLFGVFVFHGGAMKEELEKKLHV